MWEEKLVVKHQVTLQGFPASVIGPQVRHQPQEV